MLPSGRGHNGSYKCSKRDANQSKGKGKLSTRKKQKTTHRGLHKGTHGRGHVGSLDHARTIEKYLNKSSLLDNVIEGHNSFEHSDMKYNIVHRTMDSIGSLKEQEEANIYDMQLREQEKLIFEQEERQKQIEKEVLQEIEEKLERDYNYYQQIKQPNGFDKAPEE